MTMRVIFAREPFPETTRASIFLAGPTPRSKDVRSWRPEALEILERLKFEGDVYFPEDRSGACEMNPETYSPQIEWEAIGLNRADSIVFWVPRNLETFPAFTTNVEWGVWGNSGKTVFGAPREAPKNSYLLHQAKKNGVPQFETLEETLKNAVQGLGMGSERKGGECEIPLHIWRTESFQAWLKSQKQAGNRLDGARVLWTFRVGANRANVFMWVVHARVWIESEKRHKTNEVVLSRTDISSVMLWKKQPNLLDSEIILVREFRSPARTPDGFIHELPGGSTFKQGVAPEKVAEEEINEETGFHFEPSRLKYFGSRQLAGTLSAHHGHLYSLRLTNRELAWFKKRAKTNEALGNANDSERTYVEIQRLRDVLSQRLVDWSTLGMILQIISQ
ncbi:MAG: hypothetical protein A2633_02805 [Candidatus Sungbacteria bacterium RIFCSPHIGHO2_01_FULL_47_32]|uniref:Uncharacterized protein n=1 Tax=Candidatus Sungbacteria bacterium RIFCSPHIGHO2_01_FULL_47_32 TaxID=1802264 RepID=A0A1G2K571_9BACT|nr:MAG: hypothetical protein UX72_C0030G0030 [Parcubacteria group bacterium GW2011_GWA2_47_10]OGZ94323.1 MAG: hypothetical protein A2633_02805 [Candidatus Sungbacteria bacterium RIFCSPHIGHO2_01_FULL_47_32]